MGSRAAALRALCVASALVGFALMLLMSGTSRSETLEVDSSLEVRAMVHISSDNDENDENTLINENGETGAADCNRPQNLVEEANCGVKFFSFYNGSQNMRSNTKIALYGRMYSQPILELRRVSGCPVEGHGKHAVENNPGCPADPTCIMIREKHERVEDDVDVVILDKFDATRLTEENHWEQSIPRNMSNGRRRIRVLYLREAEFLELDAQREVDMVMGVNFRNGILNPNFLVRPVTYQHQNRVLFEANVKRKNFAMSVISNCEPTASRRGVLIKEIGKVVGSSKIHQYGKCGNRKTPAKPLQKMKEIARTYKFYFSFENHIMDGYVTEKLYKALTFGPVPVYYGASDVGLMKITKKKSFINVFDFPNGKELGKYLKYLEKNETAYNEYHEWRNEPIENAFHETYLELVSKHVIGKLEYATIYHKYKQANPTREVNPLRVATCCLLCNPMFLENQIQQPRSFVRSRSWDVEKLQERLQLPIK